MNPRFPFFSIEIIRNTNLSLLAILIITLPLVNGCSPEVASPTLSSSGKQKPTASDQNANLQGSQIAQSIIPEEKLERPPTTHILKPGETLYGICVKYYGTGSKLSELYEANDSKGLDINDLQIGQEITIPDLGVFADKQGKSNRPGNESKDSLATHVMQAGETLYGISVKHYGTGDEVDRIIKANAWRELDINGLPIGQEITIPHLNE